MCLLTSFGSKICLTTDIKISKSSIDSPKLKSPFIPDIIAHGIITVPDPSIGSASTKPIKIAINNGYDILNPIIFKIYNFNEFLYSSIVLVVYFILNVLYSKYLKNVTIKGNSMKANCPFHKNRK